MLMFNYNGYKVFLACSTTDMRKSINRLCDIVQHNFNLDPTQKFIFGFCNRQRNRIKLLVWEDNGFWIHFKRLEKGNISWLEALKSKLKEQEKKITLQEKEIAQKKEKLTSLKKLNEWYIEQLKLRQQKKFGVPSEKAN